MLEIFQKFVALLSANSTLVGLLTTKLSNGSTSLNIFTGPVDIDFQSQSELRYPSVVLSQVSEAVRTVPLGARDTQVQLDIFSRTSQMELETIYEQILSTLDFQSGDQGTAHVFWQRLGGGVDLFETDRRYWHRACTFQVWSIKP